MAAQQQRYRVIERIAAGGMAEVYRAESAGLEGFKKAVAIKRVLPHLSEKKEFIGMFLDEARLSAHLNHSNCVQVFDIGVGDNTYFIVMEFVDGADLKAIIETLREKNQRVAVEVACHITLKMCEGLDYAHKATDHDGVPLNIVHRDLSPPNVLVTRFGEIKVVDFGLAKANSQLESSQPGIIKGKFSYLSPEAAQGLAVDLRTDIFAAGIILWEMLAGRRLFFGDTDLATVRQVQAAKIPSLRQLNPAVSPELEQVILRALAREPANRYQTASDFGKDLNTLLFRMGRPVSSFDVAETVREVAALQAKLKAKAPKGSLIGSLIEDAMMSFTSLDAKGDAAGSPVAVPKDRDASAPLNIGAIQDVQDWAGDLDLPPVGTDRTSQLPDDYSAGNLAQLEDDAPGVSLSAAREEEDEPEESSPTEPPVPQAARPTEPPKNKKSGNGGLIFFLLLLMAAGGAIGAHYAGYIQLPISLPPLPK